MKDDRAERRDIAVLSGAEFIEHIGAAIDLRVPQRGGALGGHAARHDLMQATKHDIGQHVADRVTRRDGARPLHIEETPLGRAGGDRCERTGIVRHFRRDEAFDAESGVGERVIHHDIDAESARRRGAGVIDMDAVGPDRHLAHERQGPVVPVHAHAVLVFARPQCADRLDRRRARGLDDVLAQPI